MTTVAVNTRRLDISRALTIPGWMSEQELMWLAELGSRSLFGVEIGTYLGRSARAIAENMPDDGRDTSLICIDPFADTDGVSSNDWGQIERDCWSNLTGLCNISIWKTTSVDAATRWDAIHFNTSKQGVLLDFVFIDGAHAYLDAKRDIEDWLPKVRVGGTICGHDFGIWPGVSRAVREAFGKDFRVVGSIWHVRKD